MLLVPSKWHTLTNNDSRLPEENINNAFLLIWRVFWLYSINPSFWTTQILIWKKDEIFLFVCVGKLFQKWIQWCSGVCIITLKAAKRIYIVRFVWVCATRWNIELTLTITTSQMEKRKNYICTNYVEVLWMWIREQISSIDFVTIDDTDDAHVHVLYTVHTHRFKCFATYSV